MRPAEIETKRKPKWPKLFAFIGQIAITISVGVVIWSEIDPTELSRSINLFPLWTLGILSFVLFASSSLIAIRWQIVVTVMGDHLGAWTSLRAVLMSLVFTNFLPSTLGSDAARIWYASMATQIPIGRLVAGAFIDRLSALVSLALVSALCAPALLLITDRYLPTVAALVLSFGCLGAVGIAMLPRLIPGMFGRFFSRVGISLISGYAWQWVRERRAMVLTLLISFVCHAILVVIVMVLVVIARIEVSWWVNIILLPPLLLISMLPISVGGWGVREGAFAAGFSLVGVPVETAVALGVALGLIQIGVSILGGLAWLTFKIADLQGRT